jgi:hypothetical protein
MSCVRQDFHGIHNRIAPNNVKNPWEKKRFCRSDVVSTAGRMRETAFRRSHLLFFSSSFFAVTETPWREGGRQGRAVAQIQLKADLDDVPFHHHHPPHTHTHTLTVREKRGEPLTLPKQEKDTLSCLVMHRLPLHGTFR